ncbi:MAG TPA: hypothetical protein DCW29_22865 [Janthinobacterium sp.]|nr:hypothetical protein [Janthinobacterium sp.]
MRAARRRPFPTLALALMLGPLACLQALGARTPFQIRCEDQISKTVSVLTAQQNGYSIDTRLSYRELTAMKGGARANTFVLGLTQTESQVRIGVDGPMLDDPVSGYECVAPRIAVTLYYAPIVIYVGHEFPPGGCAYGEILKHELRHMKTYMDNLPRVEKLVRAALARRFKAEPLYAPRGSAKAALASEVDTGWLPYIKGEMGKVEVLQAAIDSPQEYARLGKACGGEIQTILRKAQRGQ